MLDRSLCSQGRSQIVLGGADIRGSQLVILGQCSCRRHYGGFSRIVFLMQRNESDTFNTVSYQSSKICQIVKPNII